MPAVGFNTFFPKQCGTVFKVKNIAPQGKRVRVFNYPIGNGLVRDLMNIPYVSEADIRHSLLKGELMIKLRQQEITVVESNIDLLQFDECQLEFLRESGIMDGLEAAIVIDGYSASFPVVFKQNIPLVGALNDSNRVFTVPTPDKFINGALGNHEFRILIRHNGKVLQESVDYLVSESGGAGTGYDTIILISFVPRSRSTLIADYVVSAF